MQKLISYILPAYNVEKYITDCMTSIVQQDILSEEYEIIIVNDGSTDGTEEQIKFFIEAHPENEIILISKQNAGVSAARNDGLKAAHGKYVWFVDPDDFILYHCMGRIKKYLEEDETDIFYLDAKTVSEETAIDADEIETDFSIDLKRKRKFKHCGPWTKIVNRQFLLNEQITFCENLAYGEDFLWNYRVCSDKTKFVHEYYINGFIYYYRLRDHSAYRSVKESRTENKEFYHNLSRLVKEYIRLWDDERYAGKELELVIRQAKQAAVFALVFLDRDYFKEEMKKMKTNGIYPYRLVWRNLKPSISWRHTVVDWCMFFLPFYMYADFLNYIIRKRIRTN